MSPSIWQILIVVAVVLVLFGGGGKISGIMGDVAKGIKSFKSNIKEDEQAAKKIEKTETVKAEGPAANTAANATVNEDEAVKS